MKKTLLALTCLLTLAASVHAAETIVIKDKGSSKKAAHIMAPLYGKAHTGINRSETHFRLTQVNCTTVITMELKTTCTMIDKNANKSITLEDGKKVKKASALKAALQDAGLKLETTSGTGTLYASSVDCVSKFSPDASVRAPTCTIVE